MKITTYEVSILIEVHDEEALLEAGRAKAIEDGLSAEDAADMDAGDCLRWIIDPGESPPGTGIQDSSVERIATRDADDDDEGEET